jgi:hypothetical protein
MWILTIFLFLLIGIPFLILFILGLRILSSNVKQLSKTTSLTFLGIWIIALLGIIFAGLEFGASHANYGQSVEKNTLNIIQNDTLVLKIKNDDTIYYQHNLRSSSRKHKVEINDQLKLYSNNIDVDVKRSATNEAYILVQKESRGKNRMLANKTAEKIEYKFYIIDNEIVLDAFFLSEITNVWKEEEIDIIIFLPENMTIYFDNSVKYFLDDVKNEESIYDRKMVNNYFKMGDAVLKCTNCKNTDEENTDF